MIVLNILWFLLLISCGESSDSPTSYESITSKEGVLNKTINHEGLNREYLLYIPDSYQKDKKAPLVFNFHGFGGSASDHFQYTKMDEVSDKESFILVYPQGSLLNGYSHWNSEVQSSTNKSKVDDIGFIKKVIEEISSEYNIDEQRIYTCGYSNGGFFSYFLGCNTNLFAGVGSVSGTMMEKTLDNCNPSHPISVISLHGTNDYVVPYKGGEGLSSVENSIGFWRSFNNTSKFDEKVFTESKGMDISRFIYSGGDNNSSVVSYVISGGGHVWFDIDIEGSNTSKIIWNFFSSYSN